MIGIILYYWAIMVIYGIAIFIPIGIIAGIIKDILDKHQ